MLPYIITGVLSAIAGGAIVAVYYKNIMAKYGQGVAVAEAIKKAV